MVASGKKLVLCYARFMKEILVLHKNVGETPLECMDRFRAENPEYDSSVKMTYAGRLDPIASGVLIALAGEKLFLKDEFLTLPKTYHCSAMLGVATDTYDILGIGTVFEKREFNEQEVLPVLETFMGTWKQAYPPYSSKTVDGKQLHELARAGELGGIEVPKKRVTVEEIFNITLSSITRSEIVSDITSVIKKVHGDFRQEEITTVWKAFAEENPNERITILNFSIAVSGGTYIRGIVDDLGKKLGSGACIWRLHRSQVGKYLDN